MKAYLIDPINKIVSVVDYNGDYQTINKLINSQRGFDAVYGFRNEDTLYVDDEGLLRKENYGFEFTYDNWHVAPLMGKALVLGTDEKGESVAVKSTLEEVESKIRWIGKVEIYHGQTGFEIVPKDGSDYMDYSDWGVKGFTESDYIKADVEEAKNSVIREEVNKEISKIFNKGGKNDSWNFRKESNFELRKEKCYIFV